MNTIDRQLSELNKILKRTVSLFKNALITDNPQHLTIGELLNNIQSGTYADQVNKARELFKEDRKKYDDFKKHHIVGFTMSAYCKHRKAQSKITDTLQNKLVYHTGILQIDIDKVSKERLPIVQKIIQNDKYTLFSFISLSGEGLKAGIMIDGSKHKESFLQAEKYYKETYNLEIDKSVKDMYRLCFVSYDRDLFINPNADTFIVQEAQPQNISQASAKLQNPKNTERDINTNVLIKMFAKQGIENAKQILKNSSNGNRHNARCKAGYLLGGYVGGNFFTKEYAISSIQAVVAKNSDLPIEKAMKDIEDAIDAGTFEPITFDDVEKKRNHYLQQQNGNIEKKKNYNNFQVFNKNTGECADISIPFCFWYETEGKNKEVVLKIEYTKMYDYLKAIGIKKLILDDKGLKRVLVRIVDHIVSEIDIPELHKILNRFVESLPNTITENKTKKDLHELLGRGINNYINDDRLNYYIPFDRIEFLQDTEDKAYFFFKNGFIDVAKNGINLKPYSKLKGYIWKSQIIEHEINILQDRNTINLQTFDFVRFTKNICSIREPERKLDSERYNSLLSTIGYLLHNYKTTANKFAVILTEANIDDEPQGRTGKGLLMQSIGKLRKITTIDGKNFSFDSQFAFQNVELDTQILFFDDVQKHFNFQRLFSAITEGLSFERKHKDRINLSAENSPKIVISTNYAIQGNSESDKGRKYEMELLCYYNANFRPTNDFGVEFFHSWNTEQWNLFYNFMLNCVQVYLQNEGKIPAYGSDTIDEKKLLNATSKEFIEYADSIERNVNIPCGDFYKAYIAFAGIDDKDKDKPTNKTVGKWLRIYCEYRKITIPANNQVKIDGKTTKCYKLVTI